MALIDTIAIFLVNLVIGGIGIYAGATLVTGEEDFGYAIMTALLGAIVWAVVSFLVGWIVILGPILTLLAWIWVINSRYEGGWVNAALIGIFAWLAVLVTLIILSTLGVTAFEAIGIPFV